MWLRGRKLDFCLRTARWGRRAREQSGAEKAVVIDMQISRETTRDRTITLHHETNELVNPSRSGMPDLVQAVPGDGKEGTPQAELRPTR
jgi:hypothetical protein